MDYTRPLTFARVADLGESLASVDMSPAERGYLEQLATERQRRHFVLGRLAARAAIREHLASAEATLRVEIRNEPEQAPRVWINGKSDLIAVSISHSSRLAVACAWWSDDPRMVSAGVDLEHARPNEVAASPYAFSERERRLLARLPEGPEILGLAAWTAKEAVWKALRASQDIGPDAIDICKLSLAQGPTIVRVKGPLATRLGDSCLQVHTKRLEGPDGIYVLSLAQVTRSQIALMAPSQPNIKRTRRSGIAMETSA